MSDMSSNNQQQDAEFVTVGKEFDVDVNENVKIRVRKTKVVRKDGGKSHSGIQLFRVQGGQLQKGKSIWLNEEVAEEVALMVIRKLRGPVTYKKLKKSLGGKSGKKKA